MILESYLKREQENITEASPSVKQEVGKIVIKKNIPVSFPMSKEASKPHDEGHHAQNIMLHNKNKPQNVDPINGMQVPKGQTVSLEKQEKETYSNGLQKENQNSRARLACTQNNIVTKTNHM